MSCSTTKNITSACECEDLGMPKHRSKPGNKGNKILSLLGSALIIALPKCHFCLLAYSSAITMCSGKTIYNHHPGAASFISIGLALIVLITLLFNYRGARTLIAVGLALTGTAFVGFSELYSGQLPHYHMGALLILTGAFLNGSIYHLVRKTAGKIAGRFRKKSEALPYPLNND